MQSWDTASKADEANDFSVCTTWLVRGNQAWLLDLVRRRLEYPDLRRLIQAEAIRHRASIVLIEDSNAGLHLVQELRRASSLNAIGVRPRGDKATRLLDVTPAIEAGRIAIPAEAPWLAEFRRELTLFPNAKHDDQVDSMSQFLGWFVRPRGTAAVGLQK